MITAKEAAIAFIVGALAGACTTTCARAETIRLQVIPPAVPGIEANGPRYSPYPGPVRSVAPSAGFTYLREPVGATRCGAAFEVISGPKAQRGCLSAR